jgi:hypothetical protein
MSESWAIYVDEEGFAQHWDDTMAAFRGLNALMEAICRLGIKAYPNEGARLFCYQFGDGFLITSDFHEPDLSRSALIAIAILRHMLAADRVARASLAEGNVADVAGCYPAEIQHAPDRSRVYLGAGLLITTPVLGEGLLRTVGLGKKRPRGPLFLADSALLSRLPKEIRVTDAGDGIILLNWLKGEPNGLRPLQELAGLAIEPEIDRVGRLTRYIERNTTLSDEWKESVRVHLFSQ